MPTTGRNDNREQFQLMLAEDIPDTPEGTCPLGYTITADKRYEIDPKHAPTVREIFQLYAEGKTVTEIITILNNKGLRTARGQLFTHNSLRTLLKNKKYIGTFEYKGEVTIENSVPPIVEPEVFNRVQELLAINKKAPISTMSLRTRTPAIPIPSRPPWRKRRSPSPTSSGPLKPVSSTKAPKTA